MTGDGRKLTKREKHELDARLTFSENTLSYIKGSGGDTYGPDDIAALEADIARLTATLARG